MKTRLGGGCRNVELADHVAQLRRKRAARAQGDRGGAVQRQRAQDSLAVAGERGPDPRRRPAAMTVPPVVGSAYTDSVVPLSVTTFRDGGICRREMRDAGSGLRSLVVLVPLTADP